MEPSRQRIIACACATLALAVGVWWLVELRSAPPPVPQVTLPAQ